MAAQMAQWYGWQTLDIEGCEFKSFLRKGKNELTSLGDQSSNPGADFINKF